VPAEKQPGRFLTIEGLDGCGKSTQLKRLAAALRGQGCDVLLTREPGGTGIGERVRAVLLDSATAGLAPWAELALMFAARAQHVEEVILPALQAGKFVLCDRFTDSSEAYQGGGRELGSGPVLALHRILCRNLQPHLTILMDSDVSASVDRARRRNLQQGQSEMRTRRPGDRTRPRAHVQPREVRGRRSDENRFELESAAFFEKVRAKYLEIARREPGRVFLVDARRPAGVVFPEILEAVRTRVLSSQFSVLSRRQRETEN
jgi:dTMP kinase